MYREKCECCGVWKYLDVNGNCKACNQAMGLKQCKRCQTVLLVDVFFLSHKRSPCKSCRGLSIVTSGPAEDPEVQETIRDLYSCGVGLHAIAQKIGLTYTVVRRVALDMGLALRAPYEKRSVSVPELKGAEANYWLGYLRGKASVSGDTVRVRIKLGDVQHLESLARYLSFAGSIHRHGTGCSIVITDPRLVAFIEQRPEEDERAHYYRGLIDARGWVGKSIGLGGEEASTFNQWVFQMSGIKAALTPHPNGHRTYYRHGPARVVHVLLRGPGLKRNWG